MDDNMVSVVSTNISGNNSKTIKPKTWNKRPDNWVEITREYLSFAVNTRNKKLMEILDLDELTFKI